MSSYKNRLPQELLARVFDFANPTDRHTCLFVCRAWHLVAKPYLYKNIEFNEFFAITRFVSCIQSTPNQPGLLVRKITFAFDNDCIPPTFPTFVGKFNDLITLCPHIEALACSKHLSYYVIKALYQLTAPLSNLGTFPYSNRSLEYIVCIERYRQTLKRLRIDCFSQNSIGECKSFPRLEDLDLRNVPMRTLRSLEYILSNYPSLQCLSASLIYRESVNDQRQEAETQVYHNMKRLNIVSDGRILDTQLFAPFLRKFSNLEQLTIICQKQFFQPAVFDSLFNIIDSLPCTSLLIEYDNSELNNDLALLQAIFKSPVTVWEHTTLQIGLESFRDKRGDKYKMRYTATNDKHRKLAITLSELNTSNLRVHKAYVMTFAPYVNELRIEAIDVNASGPLLYLILKHCTTLQSISLYSGHYAQTFIERTNITNTTVHKLTLNGCETTPLFLQSISKVCVNLNQLVIIPRSSLDERLALFNTTRLSERAGCIIMPRTQLQQLDLHLGALRAPIILKIHTDKTEAYFNINRAGHCKAIKRSEVSSKYDRIYLVDLKSVKQLRILQSNSSGSVETLNF
jgi:hypothetical protein